jgi:hypothetical protein
MCNKLFGVNKAFQAVIFLLDTELFIPCKTRSKRKKRRLEEEGKSRGKEIFFQVWQVLFIRSKRPWRRRESAGKEVRRERHATPWELLSLFRLGVESKYFYQQWVMTTAGSSANTHPHYKRSLLKQKASEKAQSTEGSRAPTMSERKKTFSMTWREWDGFLY